MKPVFRRALAIELLGMAFAVLAAQAQSAQTDFANLKIEDLMKVEVTSASKKAQKISRVPAAIFVITQGDIERSGATNVPDLLRMVPGLEVAHINASSWAVSARGFNGGHSNKLLVLIDGRTVYTPIFSGVYWDAQQVALDSVERIEIIRGPGATAWGANAVNGVINILTKQTKDTQGATVTAYGGTVERGGGSARYGGQIGGYGTYRMFAVGQATGQLLTPDKQSGHDDWYGFNAGFRADAELSAKDFMTVEGATGRGSEGELSIISLVPPLIGVRDLRARFSGWDILGRWTHVFSPVTETSLQIYFDRTQRGDSTNGFGENTLDFDFQQHLAQRRGNDLVWGLGFRRNSDDTVENSRISFVPADLNTHILSAFVQDEISIRPDHLYVTMGTKLEHEYYNGFNLQPTGRIAWIPSDRGMFWAALSGAQRTPSRVEAAIAGNPGAFPGQSSATLVTVPGNPMPRNERLVAAEAGVRRDLSDRISLDTTVFLNRYRDLASNGPAPPQLGLKFDNLIHGETHGIELFANVKLNSRWTLSPGYSFLTVHLHPVAGSLDTTTVTNAQGGNPTHQAQLRSNVNLLRDFRWTVSAYFVDRLTGRSLPSYTRLDTTVAWRASEKVSLGMVGQNLVRNLHQEYAGADLQFNPSLVRRSGYAWLTWRY